MGRIIHDIVGYSFIVLILTALGFYIYLFSDDLDEPKVTMTPDTGWISPAQRIALKPVNTKSGVRSVVVTIHHNNQSLVILDRVFSEPAPVQTTSLNLKNAGLRDGAFELEIAMRDDSLMSFGKGSGVTCEWNTQLDTQPPKVRIKTAVPVLRRGSVTTIAYSVSEDVSITDVQLSEQFFLAFLQPNSLYHYLPPLPLDTPKRKLTPELLTQGLAGNESRSRILVSAGERNLHKDTLDINDNFLNSREDVFRKLAPDDISNFERYVRINSEARILNEKALLEIGKNTSPTVLWSGTFKRLPGSTSKVSFDDQRMYMHSGVKVDERAHMGQDLTSAAHAPVPATDNDRIVFAGPLGIFDNLVVIDHGLDLQSLYSHMSEIQTNVGTAVRKGDIIGLTGTAGLTGGDHLCLGILMHDIQVQPPDWLGPK